MGWSVHTAQQRVREKRHTCRRGGSGKNVCFELGTRTAERLQSYLLGENHPFGVKTRSFHQNRVNLLPVELYSLRVVRTIFVAFCSPM